MSPAPTPWPTALAGTPAVAVIERAIERQRLAHSLLLHGENLGTLATVAHAIADRLLNADCFAGGALRPDQAAARGKPTPAATSRQQYFPPKEHPDFFALRPSGKTRIIPIGDTGSPKPGTMRDFLPRLHVSPQQGVRKVAVIYEADRMEAPSASALLKTLEEPAASTTIILITTRPYSLLATIRSRCLHFRFTDARSEALAGADDATREQWKGALAGYAAWLGLLTAGIVDKAAVAGQLMGVYGLISRFNAVLAAATDQAWKVQKEKLPPDIDDKEQEAIETGIANGIRLKLFAELEHATRDFAQSALLTDHPEHSRRAVVAAITQLEHDTGLLRLNLNEAAALEDFLLASLRLWAKRV